MLPAIVMLKTPDGVEVVVVIVSVVVLPEVVGVTLALLKEHSAPVGRPRHDGVMA